MGILASGSVHAGAPSKLISADSERCLDIAKGSQEPRTPAIIFDCHGGANQRWEFTAAGELRTFDGTRCLDIRGASTSPQALSSPTPAMAAPTRNGR